MQRPAAVRAFDRKSFSASAVLMLSLATASCVLPFDNTARFVISVDSISAPEAIGPTDTLIARFRGPLGPDWCSGLERVEKSRLSGLLQIRFHGKRRTGSFDCAQEPVMLDYVERIPPPLEDPFTIRVLQRDGAALEKVLRTR